MSWNPDQYLKFAEPRMRPALDLLSRISLEAPGQIHDLGCGTGSLTRILAQRWPDAQVSGIDDSAPMLAKAAEQPGRILWVRQNLASWAAPATRRSHLFECRPALAARSRGTVSRADAPAGPRGVLAVQMPHHLAPSHTAIAETVLDGPWRAQLGPLLAPPPVAEPAHYFSGSSRARHVDISETEYLQVLTGRDAVKEWTKGTWLKQFLDAARADAYGFRGSLRAASPWPTRHAPMAARCSRSGACSSSPVGAERRRDIGLSLSQSGQSVRFAMATLPPPPTEIPMTHASPPPPPDSPARSVARSRSPETGLDRSEKTARPGSPNIVVICMDDMGYSDIGCFGSRSQRLTSTRSPSTACA